MAIHQAMQPKALGVCFTAKLKYTFLKLPARCSRNVEQTCLSLNVGVVSFPVLLAEI